MQSIYKGIAVVIIHVVITKLLPFSIAKPDKAQGYYPDGPIQKTIRYATFNISIRKYFLESTPLGIIILHQAIRS